MKKYEYRFESVPFSGMFLPASCKGYRELITDLAAQGWRFAGQVPAQQNGHGAVEVLDLIFEREVEEG